MQLNIGANIAELRKAKNVTQEQLANAVGVSIAAVSKWESAGSYPDITLLPAISSYFGVSIDTLLDYKVESDPLQRYRDQVKEYALAADYAIGLPVAEEALRKYPNDFELLRYMAQLKFAEKPSDRSIRKEIIEASIEYHKRALAVMPVNSKVQKEVIIQNMAFAYGSIGEYDKAISILEEVNINLAFDGDIAFHLIKQGRFSEAKAKLQIYLWSMAFGFGMITDLLDQCFRAENNFSCSIDLKKLHAGFLEAFTHETPNYCDLLCAGSYLDLAKMQQEADDLESMWISVERAVYHAARFDRSPSYAMTSVKYMDGIDGQLANSSSQNACRGVIKKLKSSFKEFETDPRFIQYIEELEAAAANKREAGVWK